MQQQNMTMLNQLGHAAWSCSCGSAMCIYQACAAGAIHTWSPGHISCYYSNWCKHVAGACLDGHMQPQIEYATLSSQCLTRAKHSRAPVCRAIRQPSHHLPTKAVPVSIKGKAAKLCQQNPGLLDLPWECLLSPPAFLVGVSCRQTVAGRRSYAPASSHPSMCPSLCWQLLAPLFRELAHACDGLL
jgi:hypothetical protein